MVEACVDSMHTALGAEAVGAGRVELCGAGHGGTTPSYGLMALCREKLRIPVHVMIRPREGNFVYSDDEFDVMCRDVKAARSARVDGVVFGILRDDNTLDEERMATLIAEARPMRVGCHRAFDATPDATLAREALLRLSVNVVLTSGHADTALGGRDQIASHLSASGSTMSILAGGGIRADNVLEIVKSTGVRDVHVRATDTAVFAAVVEQLGRRPARKAP
ncbi:MAG: copper homeostasis protein CutC [Phycisphaerae bacterium]|nr:copper homeostasis protein CutC [Gemmatimonadaceae bacterium]